jgi:DNA-binding NarL/FixJ family response regulator
VQSDQTKSTKLIMMDERRKTILLADEWSLVREGLSMLCESSGLYRVVDQCDNGQSAITAIELLRPELAVIDLNIPRVFSLELIKKFRSEGCSTRFLVISNRADRKLVLEALRAGASGFLLKTGTGRHLIDALQQIMAGSVYVSPELELDKILLAQRKNANDPLESLSSREYQVFSLLIDGVRAKEIAARLDLSPKTIDTYRASLMRKLDIHDVAGLVKFAIQRELTSVA